MSIQLIQRAICYMEAHMLETINYEEVARAVYMSSYDFHRTFRFVVGITANEYIRNRRLTLAALELQQTSISVLELSCKYGYESPESFSKAFTRFHGSTPKQARQKGAILHLFNPLVIKITIEGGSIMDYRMEHRDNQRFLALVRAFPNETINDENDHSIPDFWNECHVKNLVEPLRQLRPEGKRDLYGLCGPAVKTETHFNYGIGVILDEETDVTALQEFLANGYTLWETGPAEYAVFSCIGPSADCIGETWSKFYREFLPQTGYSQTDDTDYELYFEKGEKDLFCELWIPVKSGTPQESR